MPKKILIVDDEPKIIRLARDYLEKNGYRVVTASDGQSALTIARRERPDRGRNSTAGGGGRHTGDEGRARAPAGQTDRAATGRRHAAPRV